MKKLFVIGCVLIIALCGCADFMHRKNAPPKLNVVSVASDIYTEKEIDEAIKTVELFFKQEFEGCYLTEIRYAGDEKLAAYEDAAAEYGADKAVILISSFYVSKHGGDGSLNRNHTYEDWQWILTRTDGGDWNVKTYGYG